MPPENLHNLRVVVGFLTKRSGGSDVSKPSHDRMGVLIWLLNDGFFLLPSFGRLYVYLFVFLIRNSL